MLFTTQAVNAVNCEFVVSVSHSHTLDHSVNIAVIRNSITDTVIAFVGGNVIRQLTVKWFKSLRSVIGITDTVQVNTLAIGISE